MSVRLAKRIDKGFVERLHSVNLKMTFILIRSTADIKGKQLIYNFLSEGVSGAFIEPDEFRVIDLTVRFRMRVR